MMCPRFYSRIGQTAWRAFGAFAVVVAGWALSGAAAFASDSLSTRTLSLADQAAPDHDGSPFTFQIACASRVSPEAERTCVERVHSTSATPGGNIGSS